MLPPTADAVVIGAGAAGLMCAIEAGKRGRRVVVLEHNAQAGRKILISGGGRCNFTNIHTRPENFLSANPHFAKSGAGAIQSAGLCEIGGAARDPVSREDPGAALLRPFGAAISSSMLEKECAAAGVRIATGCAVRSVTAGFTVETSQGIDRAPDRW